MPHSRDEDIVVAQRRKEVLRRRMNGERMTDIAESLGMSRNTLSRDFSRFYRKCIEEAKAEVEVWRAFQTERYEALLVAVMPDALNGDVRANEQASKLLDKISDLNGWKAAAKAEVSGPGGGPLPLGSATAAELTRLLQAAGDGEDQPEPASEPAGEDTGDDHQPGRD